eukprot:217643-Rhodomonas_salina.1
MIVDSGCNRHYLCVLGFLFRVADINTPIRGIGDNVVYATKEGLFMGYFRYEDNQWHDFSSFGMFVENGAVSLFSISQATMSGENTVVHEGKPDSGKHGMYTASGDFIPFQFCYETQLWWIPILRRREGETSCFNAAAHVFNDNNDTETLALTGIGDAWSRRDGAWRAEAASRNHD